MKVRNRKKLLAVRLLFKHLSRLEMSVLVRPYLWLLEKVFVIIVKAMVQTSTMFQRQTLI